MLANLREMISRAVWVTVVVAVVGCETFDPKPLDQVP